MSDSNNTRVTLPRLVGLSPYTYIPFLFFLCIVFCVYLLTWAYPRQKIRIESVPVQSLVYINGEYLGASPLRYKLAPGSYEIRLSSPGFNEQSQIFEFTRVNILSNLIRKTNRLEYKLAVDKNSLLEYISQEMALWSTVHHDTVRKPSFNALDVVFSALFTASKRFPQSYPPREILSLFEESIMQNLPFMSNQWTRDQLIRLLDHAFFQENNLSTFPIEFENNASYRIQASSTPDDSPKSNITMNIAGQEFSLIYVPPVVLKYPIRTYKGIGSQYYQVSQLDIEQRNLSWAQDMNAILSVFENENGVQDQYGKLEVATKAFYVLNREINSVEYDAIVSGKTHSNGEKSKPLSNISYDEAMLFVESLDRILSSQGYDYSVTLPTEYEYHAALTHFDEFIQYDTLNLNLKNDKANTQASPTNAYNLVGNLWEWTDTWYSPLPHYSQFKGPRYGAHKIIMGGSFDTSTINREAAFSPYQRVFARKTDTKASNIGFRFILHPRN